ncbi:DUF86 domain-containing protein [Microcystis aeruginosa]|jgi:uncharacterized protein with HEPN domain|uniref:DUF86 domain-containing protein n=1 Tax=Microcystis aeruginosa DA14 TaxID=1987506 RepID=A0A3E0LYS0_MICAE|nr:DUF86 domain-containing protein [Microcystis aeruginosa]REJ52689.1 MAG: DUF86 domain-containing protein [Microcystis aeruginosa DA14]CCI05904.1 conserved hypothetical protein [Microcystis aeruginosa PCC 7941]
MKRIVKNYLEDILKYAKIIQEQTINLSFEEFEQNEERVLSVMMALAIIGEASKNIPDEFRCLYPQIEWRKMAGMRDKIIHDYSEVRLITLWQTSQDNIPDLIPKMTTIINHQEE